MLVFFLHNSSSLHHAKHATILNGAQSVELHSDINDVTASIDPKHV